MKLLVRTKSKITKYKNCENMPQLKWSTRTKGGFLGMLLGTLCANLLGNLLTGKATIRAGEDTIRAGQDFYFHLILW